MTHNARMTLVVLGTGEPLDDHTPADIARGRAATRAWLTLVVVAGLASLISWPISAAVTARAIADAAMIEAQP